MQMVSNKDMNANLYQPHIGKKLLNNKLKC